MKIIYILLDIWLGLTFSRGAYWDRMDKIGYIWLGWAGLEI